MKQQGPGIGVEVAVFAQLPLQLDHHPVAELRFALGEVAVEAGPRGEDSDPRRLSRPFDGKGAMRLPAGSARLRGNVGKGDERLRSRPHRLRLGRRPRPLGLRRGGRDRGLFGDAAATLDPPQPDPATEIVDGDPELRATFVICLDAINFGSGWWPTIHKQPGHSGYFTIAAGVTERFRREGAWSAAELTEIGAGMSRRSSARIRTIR